MMHFLSNTIYQTTAPTSKKTGVRPTTLV